MTMIIIERWLGSSPILAPECVLYQLHLPRLYGLHSVCAAATDGCTWHVAADNVSHKNLM